MIVYMQICTNHISIMSITLYIKHHTSSKPHFAVNSAVKWNPISWYMLFTHVYPNFQQWGPIGFRGWKHRESGTNQRLAIKNPSARAAHMLSVILPCCTELDKGREARCYDSALALVYTVVWWGKLCKLLSKCALFWRNSWWKEYQDWLVLKGYSMSPEQWQLHG